MTQLYDIRKGEIPRIRSEVLCFPLDFSQTILGTIVHDELCQIKFNKWYGKLLDKTTWSAADVLSAYHKLDKYPYWIYLKDTPMYLRLTKENLKKGTVKKTSRTDILDI